MCVFQTQRHLRSDMGDHGRHHGLGSRISWNDAGACLLDLGVTKYPLYNEIIFTLTLWSE